MKQFLLSLYVLELTSILLLGTSVINAYAADGCNGKNPLRGTWSLTQTVPYFSPAPGTPPIAGTMIGNLVVDECGNFTGKAVANLPSVVIPYSYFGVCGNPDSRAGLFDCTVDSPEFGLVGGERACVASEKKGDCYQRFSCVIGNTTIEPGGVLLAEFTRQKHGTCQ